jgi:hypothetical protein
MQMRSTLCRLFPWLTVLALAGAPTVAAADDLDSCARQSGDAAIAACSRAIASGEFSGEERTRNSFRPTRMARSPWRASSQS